MRFSIGTRRPRLSSLHQAQRKAAADQDSRRGRQGNAGPHSHVRPVWRHVKPPQAPRRQTLA